MASTMEQRLEEEFEAWFARLQALTPDELTPEDWTERWFDGYSPEEALEDGPEMDDDD
jgi:hypothetical protein